MRSLVLTCLVLTGCSAAVSLPAPLLPEFPVPKAIHAAPLAVRPASDSFRFLVGGHLYGDSRKVDSPASTLLAARDQLAAGKFDLMVACGDTFRFSTEDCIAQTLALLQPLPFPIFNAVGNHDVAVRSTYERRFGQTYGCFVYAGCLFVLLDTELDAWQISGEQLQFLRAALAESNARDDIRAVFCFGHKLVHCHRQRYFEVLVGSNALDGFTGPNRFAADVLPLLAATARSKPVYWFGGDIGLQHTLPAFMDRDPSSGVTFLATGLGDLARDALLEVEVNGANVQVRMRSLVGDEQQDLANFGLPAWRERFFPQGIAPELAALRALLPE
jgi:hypothetical protein